MCLSNFVCERINTDRVSERERESVCVRERECVCERERERERERVCVLESQSFLEVNCWKSEGKIKLPSSRLFLMIFFGRENGPFIQDRT